MLLAVFQLLFVSTLKSQIEITRNINIDDGLAYSQVTCAYKDYKNVMWFGTSAGLSEWNGVEFKNYYKLDGLPSSFITSISEDKDNKLYAATKKGLVVKTNKTFSFPPNCPAELKTEINRLFLTGKGVLMILTAESGLWKLENGLFKKINSNRKRIIPKSILERDNGDILIGTEANGIYRLVGDSLSQIIYHKIYKKYPVVDIAELNSDTIYIALQGLGVLLKDISKSGKRGNKFIIPRDGLPDNHISDLFVTADKKLYAATTNGIAILRKDKVVKVISQNNGLLNEFVLGIFPINDDAFFFLTEGSGIFFYTENSFVTYNKSSGLLHNNVWAVKELMNGTYCFLTDEGISFMKNNKFTSVTKKGGLGDNLAVSLYESPNGDLYFGTYSDGVNKLSKGKVERLNKRVGMPQSSVWSILNYKPDTLFFVTHKKGIAVFDGKKIVDTLGIKDGLPSNNIVSSFKRSDGTILVGSEEGGIYKYAEGKFTPLFSNSDKCIIWDMYEDSTGTLYLGSDENGLIVCSPDGERDTITIKNGLSNNSVIAVESDDFGNIYAATDRGLNVVKFLKNGEIRIRQIFKQSGLANSECNQNAIYKDKNGYIWVGTIGGVTRINPSKMSKVGSVPQIEISSINVLGVEYSSSPENEINLDYDQNDITIKFAGINYLDPDIVTYRYKLIQADEDWSVDKQNEVRYANLSPGNYTFSVAAANAWGVWSEPVEVNFFINSPFWSSWWFFLLIFIILVAIIYSLFNYRLKNILRLEKLRSSISADLHDEIGSGLSEISILSELLKFNLKNETELQKGLNHIGDTTRSLIERLSDIIWIVNPRKETLKNLILRINDNYQEVLYHSDISLNIINIELLENIVLPLEIKQNLYLITKEAINNSLKYSDCNNIDFEVNKRDNKFCIEIRDDGKGFEEVNSNKGNGLYNIKKRAEKIKANVEINSIINSGTKIKVEVFLNKFKKVKL